MICVNDLWGPVDQRKNVGWWVGKGWREGDKDFGECAQNSTTFKSPKYKNLEHSKKFISSVPFSLCPKFAFLLYFQYNIIVGRERDFQLIHLYIEKATFLMTQLFFVLSEGANLKKGFFNKYLRYRESLKFEGGQRKKKGKIKEM